mgnify:CR=1 FL=1
MSHFLDRLNYFSQPREPFSGGQGVTTGEDRTWEDAYRGIVTPALKKAFAIDLELAPLFAVDQVAKAKAARGAPPFDACKVATAMAAAAGTTFLNEENSGCSSAARWAAAAAWSSS